jgi:hypothetical protein
MTKEERFVAELRKNGFEQDPHGALLRAARWAEKNHGKGFVSTAPELYALAAKAESGLLDVSDMPLLEAPWSDMLIYLDTKGIDVIADAYRRSGTSPALRVVCVEV